MSDKWNEWYKGLTVDNIGCFRYGNTITYKLGYEFLKTCDTIEDWGCGLCGFKKLFVNGDLHKYLGIDGSKTPLADIKTDLTQYISTIDGIFMRHVLEHNYEWKTILENACKSFKTKMCLILFTPFSDKTTEIAHNLPHGVDVPDLSFDKNELIAIFEKYNIKYELTTIQTDTGYNIEHIFYLNKINNQINESPVIPIESNVDTVPHIVCDTQLVSPTISLAFYTCFYGTNNNVAFTIPPIPSLKYKCYYFTNNKTVLNMLNDTNWIGIYVDMPSTDDLIESCMTAKHVKTMPQEYNELKEYDYLCFLDSKLEKVNEAFVENYIVKFFKEQKFALLLRNHTFIGPNVWDEYNESMKQHRYVLENEKYKTYIKNQLNNGLSEITKYHCMCGFLIRNMKHPKINELNATWYSHIKECGIQDQISFFFVKQLFADIIVSFSENPFIL